jgi:EAL domain-containing protein (putative c-di-GMP-specific phosphodiesterase class I)
VPGGAGLLEAAEHAATEARRAGPAAVRSYSEDIGRRMSARTALTASAPDAIAQGWIVPWFQPQLCTETGRITGFEALARWCDPERGLVSPGEFLPAIEQAGLLERLSETMLRQSLSALRAWDKAGMSIPSVAVNFSPMELRNPGLLERVRWDLDGHDLEPHRLTVEVLETVVAGQGDEVILRNLRGLAELGCRIDLDDFGTGHASIAAIRRFPIARVKIDRSFVAGIEEDEEARRLVSAILGMAERLGLETLAEGVETRGQHTILSQLGCGHVQGFGIARPMPFDDAVVWVSRLASRAEPPSISRRTG